VSDVPCECEESLLDSLVCLRTRFEEPEPKLVGELTPLLDRDSSLVVPVALVPDQDLVDTLGGVLLDVGVPCADI
jgi:hypothetical protein